jgi:polysaccharide export outer membrane protein/exopolysaccharide production protein ExoF
MSTANRRAITSQPTTEQYDVAAPLRSAARWLLPALRRPFRAVLASFVALALCGALPADAGPYTLGPQDKLRVRVFEWRQPIDQIYEWTALNAEFRVGASGQISLPLLGEIPATGLTTEELAARIGEQMVLQIRLRTPPKVAVEIAEYRPFYIVGAISKPGAYPFQPQLTVLQALSIAGGLPRPADLGMMRLGREVASGRGQLKELSQKLGQLIARKARLEAELKQGDKILFPAELTGRKDDPEIASLIAQEESIFRARRIALTTQIATLRRLKEFLVKEVGSLTEQVKLKKKELDTVNKELTTVTTLVEKGLSASNRQFGLERVTAQIASEQLSLETGLLKAQQEISRTDVSIDEAQNNNLIELASQLRATEAELNDTQVKVKTSTTLLYDSEVVFPRLVTSRQREASKDEPKYFVVRVKDGKAETIEAAEQTELQPGDTVKVELPIPDDLTAILGTPSAVQ